MALSVAGDMSGQGKVALVTGAGRGIGKAIALAYRRHGAAVGCIARTPADIRGTVAEIVGGGGRALAVTADVRDRRAVERAFDEASREFGGLDVVAINTGVKRDHEPVEVGDPSAWLETIDTNLVGAYYCARAAIPHLRRRGAGKIITIGSGLGHRGVAARSPRNTSATLSMRRVRYSGVAGRGRSRGLDLGAVRS